MRLTTDEVFNETIRILEHAKVRFECLADEFEKAKDTASWAMCSVDAGMMEKTIVLLRERSADTPARS